MLKGVHRTSQPQNMSNPATFPETAPAYIPQKKKHLGVLGAPKALLEKIANIIMSLALTPKQTLPHLRVDRHIETPSLATHGLHLLRLSSLEDSDEDEPGAGLGAVPALELPSEPANGTDNQEALLHIKSSSQNQF